MEKNDALSNLLGLVWTVPNYKGYIPHTSHIFSLLMKVLLGYIVSHFEYEDFLKRFEDQKLMEGL